MRRDSSSVASGVSGTPETKQKPNLCCLTEERQSSGLGYESRLSYDSAQPLVQAVSVFRHDLFVRDSGRILDDS